MAHVDQATQLKALKSKRTQLKSQCTRFQTYLDSIGEQNVPVAELRHRLQKVSELWHNFDSVQSSIEELDDGPGNVAKHEEERSIFEEKYFSIASEFEIIIEARSDTTLTRNIGQVPREGTPATQGSINPNDHLKLPRVNLPSFSGKFDEWIPFRNMFKSMIDQNNILPNVQKLQYLLSALKGEALDIISSFDTTDENYAIAWESLRERYDDSSWIVQKHIKALFELPIISKENHLLLRRMIDNVSKHLRSLKALNRPTDYWDDMIVYLITSRLDPKTNRAWEVTLKRGQMPNTKQLLDFLAQHCRALEASDRTLRSVTNQEKSNVAKPTSAHVSSTRINCAYCSKQDHPIYACKDYLQLDAQKRTKEAISRKLCLNCLKSTHRVKQCGAGGCRRCGKRHNTILHWDQKSANEESSKEEATIENVKSSNASKIIATSANHYSLKQNNQVLLATAIVDVIDNKGNARPCRALLDGGSQSCFITNKCAKELDVKQHSINIPVSGLDKTTTHTHKRVNLAIMSRVNGFKVNLTFLVINQITQAMPIEEINMQVLQIPKGIELADPKFDEASQVDLLLGAEIFFDILCTGKIKISATQPTWQKTLFGWVVAGNSPAMMSKQSNTICNLAIKEELNANIIRFWQIEQCERLISRSPEERICEEHFQQTYRRNEDGRFVVTLPTKNEQLQRLGESRDIAIQRFKALEKKLDKNPQFKAEYTDFMQQYLKLGHMREIQEDSSTWDVHPQCYLPHHGVTKESSTTRLRVVFDASSKTASGISLNQALLVGPVIQQDLFSIVLRFRIFKYVITADVAKMYRQIRIDKDQTPLQRIVWRDHASQNLKTFELLTLTYGTAPASFLATKVIQELAHLEENQYPKGAFIAHRDFYMDDLITGANSIEELKVIHHQIAALMQKGGFTLRKWASNTKEVLEDSSNTNGDSVLSLDKDSASKILGVTWNRLTDTFQYSIKTNTSTVYTKRLILSDIAKIFDPLGLLAPVLITAKILMQSLWKINLNWDETVPPDISHQWTKYIADIKILDGLSIKRKVLNQDIDTSILLHGFCDASEKAYGACVYLRSEDNLGNVQVQLLCAKSRVAPIKVVSIPRLELCGAQLLVQLMRKVKEAMGIDIHKSIYWTDSSIVIHWIKATNKKLPVFVAHRVGEIQDLTSVDDWYHVGTKENPADLVSRGCNPNELLNSQLWWKGPGWLQDRIIVNNNQDTESNQTYEEESREHNTTAVLATIEDPGNNWISRFSAFRKLVRVTAMCIRFIQFCRKRTELRSSQSLTVEELNYARECLIKMEQQAAFRKDIVYLQNGKRVANNSPLRSLNPFLDKNGLLRVGGRLRHAELQYKTKHPIVLPQRSKLTELIIRHEHIKSFHAGADTTLAAVRQSYWPLRARGVVRKLIRQCVICFRFKPCMSEQIMGDLPLERVKPSRPFTSTGIDFCGPIFLREGKRRAAKRVKAYVAVFVCMSVKAVHMEIVSDLSTGAFLNALKRFISRRGKPTNIFTDNGTNFVGANRELQELRKLLIQEQHKIINSATSEGIKWHFTPARSPHFGGLWESNVKSFKRHFYKIIGETALTFEEASTVISQIEAILNSRPLTALSEDPNDLSYLSPGHFLIGDALISYPEPDITHEKIGRLSRWQMLEHMRQCFWRRWSSEYLLSLQQRNKWQANKGQQLKAGQLILCKEEGLPPLNWTLGRIQETFPGADGIVRTAVIKTASGTYKRPAVKLCALPLEDYSCEQ